MLHQQRGYRFVRQIEHNTLIFGPNSDNSTCEYFIRASGKHEVEEIQEIFDNQPVPNKRTTRSFSEKSRITDEELRALKGASKRRKEVDTLVFHGGEIYSVTFRRGGPARYPVVTIGLIVIALCAAGLMVDVRTQAQQARRHIRCPERARVVDCRDLRRPQNRARCEYCRRQRSYRASARRADVQY